MLLRADGWRSRRAPRPHGLKALGWAGGFSNFEFRIVGIPLGLVLAVPVPVPVPVPELTIPDGDNKPF
jgi:hypothetical protein